MCNDIPDDNRSKFICPGSWNLSDRLLASEEDLCSGTMTTFTSRTIRNPHSGLCNHGAPNPTPKQRIPKALEGTAEENQR